MLNLVLGFILCYFTLNIILLIIATVYDRPKDVIKNGGLYKLVKAIITLLFVGCIFLIVQIIDDLK